MTKLSRQHAREADELKRQLEESMIGMAAAGEELDAVRLRMRQCVPVLMRPDVFDAEITGITHIPEDFSNGHGQGPA
jgi:hypothetical protein